MSAAAAASPVVSLGFAGGSSATGASLWDRRFASLQAAGLDAWKAAVGETFALRGQSAAHMVRVAAVTAFPRSGPRPAGLGRSEAFSVTFEAVAGPPLPAADGVYQLVHRSYPPLPIYMGAPAGPGKKARLIAVFN